jgi:hypothetical protein
MATINQPVISDDVRWFKLEIPYDRDFIGAFKNNIPLSSRWWDDKGRCWHVQVHYLDEVIELCQKYFGEVDNRFTNKADMTA